MKIFKIILIGLVALTSTSEAQIHVDLAASGNNDGTSWADAFTDIQSAVNAAMDNDEILIAEGTYGGSNEILITKPMTIKGGYPSGGGGQDINANITILSSANINRVLRATHITGTLYLEGLTIQEGSTSREGGGIKTSGDLNLNFVTVHNNIATSSLSSHYDTKGAGIYSTANITLVNSQVSHNSTSSGTFAFRSIAGGGGIYGTANITLINSLVSYNAVSAFASNASTSDYSYSTGGGIHGEGNITLTNSLVMHNMVASGYGYYSNSFGGGIFGGDNSTIELINSQVSKNTASTDSGFTLNSNGGGVYGSDFTVLHNSILWGNRELEKVSGVVQTDGFNEHEGGTLTTSHSLIRGEDLSTYNGIDATNIGFDPLFADEANDDFRLLVGSPLIDAGNFSLLPLDVYDIDTDGDLTERIPIDLDGLSRELGVNVDMGPYEYSDLIFKDGFDITE
ncbi:MAG: hypothetical protein ACSHWU_08385 [Marinicella sp.]